MNSYPEQINRTLPNTGAPSSPFRTTTTRTAFAGATPSATALATTPSLSCSASSPIRTLSAGR